MLPDFLIIGVQRGGTSSLHATLATHPQLIPGAGHKEIHFFDNHYHRGIAWYSRHFKRRRSDQLLYEATPSYLFRPAVPQRVKRHLPEARFIVMLRNPALRAWSQWWHYRHLYGGMARTLRNPDSEPVRRGVYAGQFERWFEHFPRRKFFIMTSEQFFEAPLGLAETAVRWLGLKSSTSMQPVRTDPLEHWKRKYGKYQGPPDKIAGWLMEYYRPHNKRLEELLGMRFYW